MRLTPQRGINRLPVVTRDVGHVLGGLQTTFDFERTYSGLNQLGNQIVGGQILRTQEISNLLEVNIFTVANHFIRQSTGLSALSTVGTPPTQTLARQTLPGIGHTKRPMHENLKRHGRMLTDLSDLVEAQFPGQNHSVKIQVIDCRNPLSTGKRHLS